MNTKSERGKVEKKAKTQNPPRNELIDICKGAAILLVLLGHVLQSHLVDYDHNILYRLIYTFHMPLFFILSGFVVNPDTPKRIRKTLTRLLPPFFSWHLVSFVAMARFKSSNVFISLMELLKNPDTGLWFLWILALSIVALVFCRKIECVMGFWIYLLAVLCLFALPLGYFGIPLLKYHFPYFVGGYLLARSQEAIKRLRLYGLVLSIPAYLLVFPFWHRLSDQVNERFLDGTTMLHVTFRMMWFIGAKYSEGVTGSIIAISVLYYVSRLFSTRWFIWLGRHTLEIYASHQLFIVAFPGDTVFAMAGAFFFALFASIAIAFILKKAPFCDLAFYGISNRRHVVET